MISTGGGGGSYYTTLDMRKYFAKFFLLMIYKKKNFFVFMSNQTILSLFPLILWLSLLNLFAFKTDYTILIHL